MVQEEISTAGLARCAATAGVAPLSPVLRSSVQVNDTTLTCLNPDAIDELVIPCRYFTSA